MSEVYTVRPDGLRVEVRQGSKTLHFEHEGLTYKYCSKGFHWVETCDFSSHSCKWDGLYIYCKVCTAAYQRERWRANISAKKVSKFNSIRRRYGLSQERWQQMWDRFDGRCHLCRKEFDPNPLHTHVDHCYVTGRIRGLLCSRCNKALGFVEQVPDVLNRFEAYLENDFDWNEGEITEFIQSRLRPPPGDECFYEVGLMSLACDE